MAKSYAAQYNKAKYLSKDVEQDIRWGGNKQIRRLLKLPNDLFVCTILS